MPGIALVLEREMRAANHAAESKRAIVLIGEPFHQIYGDESAQGSSGQVRTSWSGYLAAKQAQQLLCGLRAILFRPPILSVARHSNGKALTGERREHLQL